MSPIFVVAKETGCGPDFGLDLIVVSVKERFWFGMCAPHSPDHIITFCTLYRRLIKSVLHI